ncbi:MAG: NYN domain-containing protein [Lachnospiraceae bacterium]|nr:NYN domain-containing protein [Lachnospiraceae bacterium]
MNMENDKKFALLIDADNISPKYIDIILTETVNYGIASIRRIYGDWTNNAKRSWKECLLLNSLTPVQQFSNTTGKNASDSAMIIDAMDILYSNHVDGFVIASSDSDFTALARRLKEDGKMVIGMGESKTPMPFIKVCDQFKTLDVLFESKSNEDKNKGENEDTSEKKSGNGTTAKKGGTKSAAKTAAEKSSDAQPITSLATIRKAVMEIIDEQTEEGDFLQMSKLSTSLQKRYPDFDYRVYKFSKFSQMLKSFSDIELTMRGTEWVVGKKGAETVPADIQRTVLEMVGEKTKNGEWMAVGSLLNGIRQKYPKFDYHNYGFSHFHKMLKSFPGLEFQQKNSQVRKKQS